MHTEPAAAIAETQLASEARELLRACVHCGFCLPACPTYRITGSELDSPRGRIYLVKQMLERGAADATAQAHLDRCLTCRACETACPSGVQYGRIADLGREFIERAPPPEPRPLHERLLRSALLATAPQPAVFGPLVRIGQAVRPLLPRAVAQHVPPRAASANLAWPEPRHPRRMAVLEGCVQPALAPQINAAAARVCDRLGISLVRATGVGCCGALDQHLGRTASAVDRVKRNVAASLRLLDDDGCEAIVSTASGCGVYAKDYAHVLRDDTDVEVRRDARRVAQATRDLCEALDVVALREAMGPSSSGSTLRVAWQAPCSLQHGQRAATTGKSESLLQAVGCELVPVADATLCCGSAGTYSVLQPGLARELRARKLESLLRAQPDVIATANIGCHEHLRAASSVPVRHWIELIDSALARVSPLAQPSQ